MTVFEPRQVRTWSTRELDQLIGRHVTVTMTDSETAGVVEYTFVSRSEISVIEYRGGASIDWRRTDDVTIHVHEETP